jgi:hypothetical protein
MSRRLRALFPVLTLAASLAACETTPPIEPEDPQKVTLQFTGTLTVNGAITHRFTTRGLGDITVTLKSLGPVGTPPVGLALGVWTGASCNLIIVNENAATDASLIGTATAAGEFCTRIADQGRLTEPASYGIGVTHF